MTQLEQRLIAQIRENGPLTVAEYMTVCLLDPTHGYYTNRDPLGAAGDFTTAPEISQMFGELLGLALAQAWLDRGAPASLRLVELGPGRGTLMADALRATAGIPGFHDALSLHLVEASPALRKVQNRTINQSLHHHDSFDEVPDGPLFLIANEFFDALPVRQFQRVDALWRERLIGISDDRLTFGLSDPIAPAELLTRLDDTKDGDIVETSPAAQSIAAAIGRRIDTEGGIALIVDYGGWHSLGDTFQAVKKHGFADPLEAPGSADLTAHVDFEALAKAGRPAVATEMTPQGVFLERLGITPRAQKLAQSLSGTDLDAHIAAHRRLTHPQETGTLFKAMALYQKDTTPPPGFEA